MSKEIINYTNLYDTLYFEGYHISKSKNMGLIFVDYLCDNYNFNTILDVGCSQGITVDAYEKKGKEAYGIDISNIAINKVKELNIKNCYVANVINIPFATKKFDSLVTCDVLEHLMPSDINKAIYEIIRVTKKYLFIKVATNVEKNRGWIELIKRKYPRYKHLKNLHLTIMSLNKWITTFENTDKVELLEINKELNNILIFKIK